MHINFVLLPVFFSSPSIYFHSNTHSHAYPAYSRHSLFGFFSFFFAVSALKKKSFHIFPRIPRIWIFICLLLFPLEFLVAKVRKTTSTKFRVCAAQQHFFRFFLIFFYIFCRLYLFYFFNSVSISIGCNIFPRKISLVFARVF